MKGSLATTSERTVDGGILLLVQARSFGRLRGLVDSGATGRFVPPVCMTASGLKDKNRDIFLKLGKEHEVSPRCYGPDVPVVIAGSKSKVDTTLSCLFRDVMSISCWK